MKKPLQICVFLLVIACGVSRPAAASNQTPAAPAPAPQAPSPEALAQTLGIGVDERATISRFSISGNTVYEEPQLQTLLASWENKPLTAQELMQAAERLKTHYRNSGFAYADVRVPAQTLATGNMRVEVLEGRVAAIEFKGNQRYSSEFLAARISDLAPGTIITNAAYQRSVILLNTLPGLAAQIAINPTPTPGMFNVSVGVRETRVQSTVTTDNQIQSSFGSWEAKLQLNLQNPTKQGDSLTFEPSALQKKWPSGFRVGYARPLGHKGTSVNVLFVKADFQFISGSPLMGLQNNITYTVATVNHPIKLSFLRNVFLSAGLVRVTSAYVFDATQIGPTELLNVGTVSIVLAEGQAGKATTNAFAQFSSNFRRNPDGQRNNAQVARFDMAGGHERWFNANTSLFVFGIGVLTPDPLLLSQKVTIGGPFCVRGFDVNEVLGDQGYLAKAELRRQWALPDKTPVTFKVMLDDAAVWRKFPDAKGTDSDHLISGGLGIAVKFRNRYSASLEWAVPLNDHPVKDGRKHGRFWFTAAATY